MNRGYIVGATPHTVLYRFFWNFTGVLVIVWRYACDFDIIFRLFLLLFSKLNLVIFQALYITKWIYRGNLVGATPPAVLYRFFPNFSVVLVMVWKYACGLDSILRVSFLLYNPQLNVYHFSSILRLQCYQYLINVDIYVVPLSANAPTVLYNSLWKHLYVHMSWPEDMDKF